MRLDVPLDPDEAVLLAYRGGGTRAYPIWLSLLVVFVVLTVFSCLGTAMIALVGFSQGADELLVSGLTLVAAQLPCVLTSLFLVVLGVAGLVLPRSRPFYFFTTKHIVGKRVLGRAYRIPLDQIERVERFVHVTYGRYGARRETATDELQLWLRRGNVPPVVRFGPIDGIDDFLSLFEEARSREHVELEQLPRADGSPAPCETRSDLFVTQRTRSLGMSYGPLFIGPTTVLRFTEALPMGALGRFYTRLGHAVDGEEAELHAKQLVKHPSAGHVLVIDREAASPTLDGNVLHVRAGDRKEPIELTPEDAARLRTFLRA